MEKIKEIKPITLDGTTQDYWRDFGYGKDKEKLKIGREVRGNVGGGLIKIGRASIPSGYVNFAITGVGFRPKVIQVVVRGGGSEAQGNADELGSGLVQSCFYGAGATVVHDPSRLFRFSSTNVGDLVTIDSDGFTVKSDIAATMIYTCFG